MDLVWSWDLVGLPALAASALALTVAILLVATRNWHGHLTMDSVIGVQKFHTAPTPRIGGVPIAFGVVLGGYFAPNNLQVLLLPLILAGVPAFVFGLAEDLTKRVSVRARLLATMGCGVLGWAITGFAITRANVPGLDWLLGFTLISVAFTAFTVGGIANAINIIDGFNGLSSGTVVLILLGFTSISLSVGDTELAQVCIILAAAVLGFFMVNWPLGKIFLGDGGAYFVGFGVAWIAVLLLERHPEVSAWAPLLVCGYPFLEVMFSIKRRRRRGVSTGEPDRLHLHSLVKKRVVRQLFPRVNPLFRNSITGMVMWFVALVPVLIAVRVSGNHLHLALGLGICAIGYSSLYARITQFCWCLSPTTTRETTFVPR